MGKDHKQDKGPDGQYSDDEFTMMVVSATECTGMVPTPPLTVDQVDSYRYLLSMPQQEAGGAKKADSPPAKTPRCS